MVLAPVRLEKEVFRKLNWLPDPVKVDGEWKKFDEVYGTETNDDQRPSKAMNPTSASDVESKKMFIAGKLKRLWRYM